MVRNSRQSEKRLERHPPRWRGSLRHSSSGGGVARAWNGRALDRDGWPPASRQRRPRGGRIGASTRSVSSIHLALAGGTAGLKPCGCPRARLVPRDADRVKVAQANRLREGRPRASVHAGVRFRDEHRRKRNPRRSRRCPNLLEHGRETTKLPGGSRDVARSAYFKDSRCRIARSSASSSEPRMTSSFNSIVARCPGKSDVCGSTC